MICFGVKHVPENFFRNAFQNWLVAGVISRYMKYDILWAGQW